MRYEVPMKKKNEITGVVLAAGLGSRIKPLSFDTPKPLLPVCNKPIMQYQIEAMVSLGITSIIVVVGHLKEKIVSYFGDGARLGVSIRYIEQEKALGIAHAVGQLESHIDGPFLLFLGDIFMIYKDLPRLLSAFDRKGASAVLVVKKEENPESIKRNFAIQMSRTGTVKKVIEKPRYTINEMKGCGIYLFDLPIFDAIRRTPRTALRDEYELTNSIQILIEDGYKAYVAEVVEWDMNVTVPDDLLECNLRYLKSSASHSLIGNNVELASGTQVINSVIGDNVRIMSPICISDSVILPGVSISSAGNINRSLISSHSLAERGPDVAL